MLTTSATRQPARTASRICVCAVIKTPSTLSTTNRQPSTSDSAATTSSQKLECPGVSTRLKRWLLCPELCSTTEDRLALMEMSLSASSCRGYIWCGFSSSTSAAGTMWPFFASRSAPMRDVWRGGGAVGGVSLLKIAIVSDTSAASHVSYHSPLCLLPSSVSFLPPSLSLPPPNPLPPKRTFP